MEKSIDAITQTLEEILTPKRLEHCLGVQRVMKDLSSIYHFDTTQAQFSGLLHDAAKDLSQAEITCLLNEGTFKITCDADKDFVHYQHAPLGALYIQKQLGIKDEVILGAVATHAFMKIHPTFHEPLNWCLRFADLIEPSRNWEAHPIMVKGAKEVRDLVFSGKLWQAAYIQSDVLIRWFTERGIAVHPDMVEVREEVQAMF